MTQEEAIRILKDFHDKSALFSVRTALETLHPELKESEDETIRKEIIEFVDINTLSVDERHDRWIAWIEKQGEQKPTDKSATTKQEDEIEIPFGAKDSELQEATYYIPKGFHTEIDDDKVIIKKGEKTAAWSDEDEENLQHCCMAISVDSLHTYEDKQEMEAWLKSLKDRIRG